MLEQIKGGPVVSCQALPDESLYSSLIMGRVAFVAKQGGAVGIRVQSREDIIEIKGVVGLPVTGVVKCNYPDSDIYITATRKELDELFETGCEMIATDTTLHGRPNGEKLGDLVNHVYEHGVLAMADCSTYEECVNVESIGLDCIFTTLCRYAPYSKNVDGPDLELFKKLTETIEAPILARGEVNTSEGLAAVHEASAYSAVVSGVITCPKQITERFVRALKKQDKRHSFDKMPRRMYNYMHMTALGYLSLLPAGTGSRLLKVL